MLHEHGFYYGMCPIRNLFKNCIRAVEVLEIDKEFNFYITT